MARPAKPTALHEIDGGYLKHPERRNQDEPKPEKGIGPAPEDASIDWLQCWDELVENIPPGVLGNTDRVWLERAAKLLALSRQEGKFSAANETALQTYLSKLGMNPADRSKITVPKQRDDDKADKYF